MPTQEDLKKELTYVSSTGVFYRNKGRNKGMPCDSLRSDGYMTVWVNKKNEFAHRMAWIYVYGSIELTQIDHINGIRSDNRIENLRNVSIKTNMENQTKAQKSNKKSGLLGSHWNKGTRAWEAKIQTNRKTLYLGSFDTPEKAHLAYLHAKRALHMGCTI